MQTNLPSRKPSVPKNGSILEHLQHINSKEERRKKEKKENRSRFLEQIDQELGPNEQGKSNNKRAKRFYEIAKSKKEQLKRELDKGGEHEAEANKNVRQDTTEEATAQRAQHQELTVTSNNSTPRPQTGGILGVLQQFNKACQEEKEKKKERKENGIARSANNDVHYHRI